MIQLIAIILCTISTQQLLQLILQKDKVKDAWVLLCTSGLWNFLLWVLVFTWDFK